MALQSTGDRLFELSPDLLCVLSLGGYFLEFNSTWTKTLGYSTEELKSLPLYDFIYVDDREETILAFEQIKAGLDDFSLTNRFSCKNGSVRWLSWTAAIDEELIYAIAHDITQRIEREQDLRRSLAQRQELLARLLSVREEERTQLARVVHDEMGQVLTGLKMDVVWLQKHLKPDQTPLIDKTLSMSSLIDSAIQSVREISFELRPPILDDLGLVAAIEWQLHELKTRTGLQYVLFSSEEEIELDIEGRTTVFRIFQEILTNVARHAQASKVTVTIYETDECLVLQVRDNGRGISEDELRSAKSIGLLGMVERAHLRNGTVEIRGVTKGGTTVIVQLPLNDGSAKFVNDRATLEHSS